MSPIIKAATPRIRPPLKWAGNKFQILERINAKLPAGKRLIEPFSGSAALFLNTDFDRYLLNDINSDLIHFYKTLQSEGRAFIDYAKHLFTSDNNAEEAYYDLREQFNDTDNARLKAALFLYINKHGYNGLCRYNASGRLNVPFGRYKRPYFPEKELLYFFEKSRKNVTFENKSFEAVMKNAREGDVVYCDPPYVPLSDTANFTAYSAGGFSMHQQKQLAELAEQLAQNGISVLISNHYTSVTKSIYSGAIKYKFDVRRTISCDGTQRNMAREVLAVFKAKRNAS